MADSPCQAENNVTCFPLVSISVLQKIMRFNSSGSSQEKISGINIDISNWDSQISIRDSHAVVRHGNNYVDPDPVTDIVHWTIVFIFTPTISIFGIIGNTLSLIVLAKHGFTKSSNILLFSLAISDILFMIGINGPSKPMYEWGVGGFQYPEETSRVLYYLYQVTDSLNWTCCPTSVFIPVLVMIERLIAVFLPLRFASIVTVRRTVIAIVVPLILSILTQVYIRTWFTFAYVFDSATNISIGIVARTEAYWSQRQVSEILKIVDNAMFILVVFVGCGCIAIGVKMKMVAKKRIKMTNNFVGQKTSKKDADSSRTTKMLLCLCIFYTFACTPVGFPAIIPGFMVFPVFEDEPRYRSVGVFVFHLYKLVFCINASCNFYIYVATNKKFRDTFCSIVCR